MDHSCQLHMYVLAHAAVFVSIINLHWLASLGFSVRIAGDVAQLCCNTMTL